MQTPPRSRPAPAPAPPPSPPPRRCAVVPSRVHPRPAVVPPGRPAALTEGRPSAPPTLAVPSPLGRGKKEGWRLSLIAPASRPQLPIPYLSAINNGRSREAAREEREGGRSGALSPRGTEKWYGPPAALPNPEVADAEAHMGAGAGSGSGSGAGGAAGALGAAVAALYTVTLPPALPGGDAGNVPAPPARPRDGEGRWGTLWDGGVGTPPWHPHSVVAGASRLPFAGGGGGLSRSGLVHRSHHIAILIL